MLQCLVVICTSTRRVYRVELLLVKQNFFICVHDIMAVASVVPTKWCKRYFKWQNTEPFLSKTRRCRLPSSTFSLIRDTCGQQSMSKLSRTFRNCSRFIPPEKRKHLVFDVIRTFPGGAERYQWHEMGKTLWKRSYFRKVFGPENYRKLYNFLLHQMWKYPISSGWPCRPLNP